MTPRTFRYFAIRSVPSGWGLMAVLSLMLMGGCTDRANRFQRLTELASAEVRELPDPLDRLRQFLQLADLQSWRSANAVARTSRDAARDVLLNTEPAALADEPRLAGWISLAQLARYADCADESRDAARRAETLLRALEPVHSRVPYVRSVAGELEVAEDRDAAIELYRDAGGWAVEYDDLKLRRNALLAIAAQLVELNSVDAAATVIRRDDDRLWRAESFVALSGATPHSGLVPQFGSIGPAPAGRDATALDTPARGDLPAPAGRIDSGFRWKQLDFKSYFGSR
ncbi:MAG: hypothetical protein HZB38_06820 [Planctomycetes bacterium]|nr:hypothetical protein [Planctomycetota bacterium]